MAQAFTLEIFNQPITVNYSYSSSDFADQLGQADDLAIEVNVDVSGGPLTVSAEYEHSNKGTETTYDTATGMTGNSGSISAPASFWLGAPSVVLGAFGRVKVWMSGGSGSARVQVVATGRLRG